MRNFEIEQVSLTFKWTYKTIMPALPVIGTEAFGVLTKKLSPFGLSASGIIAEAPSNRLGDTQMTIFLFNNRLGIRFSVSSFEIITNELLVGDEQIIADIGGIIFEALGKIDAEVTNGSADINLRYHLTLESDESKKILSEHLTLANDNPNLSPDMASYQVNLGEDSTMQSARVAIAESLAYQNAVFFDININYPVLDGFTEFANNVKDDVIMILNIFGLNGKSLR